MKTLIVQGSRPLNPPKDWDQDLDGACGVLHVVDHVELQSGMPVIYSFYQPTQEDIKAFKAGGCIRLGILGGGHPVINLSVFGPLVTEELKAVDGFDMGSVIERTD